MKGKWLILISVVLLLLAWDKDRMGRSMRAIKKDRKSTRMFGRSISEQKSEPERDAGQEGNKKEEDTEPQGNAGPEDAPNQIARGLGKDS